MVVSSYTVEQANRALPLVRRIVEDIVQYHARWREMVGKLEAIGAAHVGAQRDQAENLQTEIQGIAAEIDRFIRELADLGVQLKGFDPGLVDFPGEMFGRQVCLCWRLGEPAVEYWHEVDAGYAGRQPIDHSIPE